MRNACSRNNVDQEEVHSLIDEIWMNMRNKSEIVREINLFVH